MHVSIISAQNVPLSPQIDTHFFNTHSFVMHNTWENKDIVGSWIQNTSTSGSFKKFNFFSDV